MSFFAGYQGAVSLSYDDGTTNQLEEAVPPLDERDLKGTFYVHPRDSVMERHFDDWSQVASSGHEIGNHTLSHICPNNIMGRRGGLEDLSLSEIEDDVLGAQERLEKIAPHQKEWTFCYPCGGLSVGRGEDRVSFVPLIARHFLAGRTAGEYGFGAVPEYIDLTCIPGLSVERMSGFEMIGLVEELTHRGHWVVLIFHGINDRRLSVASDDYEMLLDYLVRRREGLLVAPSPKLRRELPRAVTTRVKVRPQPAISLFGKYLHVT